MNESITDIIKGRMKAIPMEKTESEKLIEEIRLIKPKHKMRWELKDAANQIRDEKRRSALSRAREMGNKYSKNNAALKERKDSGVASSNPKTSGNRAEYIQKAAKTASRNDKFEKLHNIVLGGSDSDESED